MRRDTKTMRAAVLEALQDMLAHCDRNTQEIARREGQHPDSYGVPWEEIPRQLLDQTGRICEDWNADKKITTVRNLMKLALWTLMAAESLYLWPLSPADELMADDLIRRQQPAPTPP